MKYIHVQPPLPSITRTCLLPHLKLSLKQHALFPLTPGPGDRPMFCLHEFGHSGSACSFKCCNYISTCLQEFNMHCFRSPFVGFSLAGIVVVEEEENTCGGKTVGKLSKTPLGRKMGHQTSLVWDSKVARASTGGSSEYCFRWLPWHVFCIFSQASGNIGNGGKQSYCV